MGGGGSRWSPPPPPRNCDAELNNMRNNYNGQLNNLRNQLNNKQNEVNWLYGRINDINNELQSSRQSDKEHIRQLNDWRMKYEDSQKNVAELKVQIKSLEQQIEDLLKRIANLKVSAEVSSNTANAAISNLEKMSNMGPEMDPEHEPIREGVMGMFNDLVNWMNQNNNTMYDAVLAQNTTLDNQIQEMKNQYTTDDQKTVYQLQQNGILNKVNIWLLITYYALVLVFGYTFYKTNKTLSVYLVLLVILLAAAYPWVISPVESAAYFVWRLGVAVIHGNVSGEP
jgi:DNA repair exonuclease SbcCD ATPase subunit